MAPKILGLGAISALKILTIYITTAISTTTDKFKRVIDKIKNILPRWDDLQRPPNDQSICGNKNAIDISLPIQNSLCLNGSRLSTDNTLAAVLDLPYALEKCNSPTVSELFSFDDDTTSYPSENENSQQRLQSSSTPIYETPFQKEILGPIFLNEISVYDLPSAEDCLKNVELAHTRC
uniref:Uncharacterized protein n=1 Tax=Romanomermis culicivorax TaxID=13658 RepID=A0A915IL71_ROMCU